MHIHISEGETARNYLVSLDENVSHIYGRLTGQISCGGSASSQIGPAPGARGAGQPEALCVATMEKVASRRVWGDGCTGLARRPAWGCWRDVCSRPDAHSQDCRWRGDRASVRCGGGDDSKMEWVLETGQGSGGASEVRA